MSTDRIRAALQALTELEGHTLVDCTADWAEAMIEARAALAQPGAEVVGPTDDELLRIAASAIDPYESCGIAIGEYEAETESAVEAYGSELIAYARAVLQRWGGASFTPIPSGETTPMRTVEHGGRSYLVPESASPTDEDAVALYSVVMALHDCQTLGDMAGNFARAVLARWGHQPAPPAEGEVGEVVADELVRQLRTKAATEKANRCHYSAILLTRAADLLEQRHPAPVPVNEHPWKRDRWCDDEDRCWCFNQWDLQWELENYTSGAHWCEWMLPFTALPLPQGEVEP